MSGQYERRDKACPVSTGEEGRGGEWDLQELREDLLGDVRLAAGRARQCVSG